MTWWKWSRTAATNANADLTINWSEGQSPSSVNDSARAMMAASAKYRDDISGAIVTGGTGAAYTLTSYQVFDTLANMNGAMIAFTPNITNTGTVTLNVDGLGAKALRSATSIELPSGTVVAGTPYVATYYNATSEWVLQGFIGNPYNVPVGAILPFAGASAPNSSFVLPYGQALSRTTYATLFAQTSTYYGVGDGSTTFNVPDLRGRMLVGYDNMGGVGASRISSGIGVGGGAETVSFTLAAGDIPQLSGSGTTSTESATHTHAFTAEIGGSAQYAGGGGGAGNPAVSATGGQSTTHTHTYSFNVGAASPSAVSLNKMSPYQVGSYILRVI